MAFRGFLPSFAGGVIGPSLYGRIDLAKYDVALREGVNVIVHPHGGVSNRAGFEFVGEVDNSEKKHRLIPFVRDDETNSVLVMGDNTVEFVENGAFVTLGGGGRYTLSSPYPSGQLFAMDYEQSVDVVFFTHRAHAPKKLVRSGAGSWAFQNVRFNPTVTPPTGLALASSNSDGRSWTYAVSSVTASGQESVRSGAVTINDAADLSESGRFISLSWDANPDADVYNVYRRRNGQYAYIGFTEATTFTDDNISPNVAITPVRETSLFSDGGKYPGKVAIFQQRLFYASSRNQPEQIWASRVGDYENFTKSFVLKADDRFEVSLSGRSINPVQALLPMRELLAFGGRGGFSISGDQGFLDSTAPVVTQFSYTGASDIKPIAVDDTVLFVDRSGSKVRDLRYAIEQDGYAGNDLTILADHFFKGREIVDWAYAESPDSIVWVVTDDGALLSMTYKREHQVWAWTEHDISGFVESAAVVSEGSYDALYIIARKEVQGVDRRYVLRLHERAFDDICCGFFLDYGLSYSGPPTQTFSGLDHIEGERVMALADGNVVENLVVSSGSVALPRAASQVHVGIPYTARMTTLPPSINLQGYGTSRGRPQNINRVLVQVEKTRGVSVGGAPDLLTEWLQVTGPDVSASIEAFTGFVNITVPGRWVEDGGSVTVEQRYPLPMTILAIAPDTSIGR